MEQIYILVEAIIIFSFWFTLSLTICIGCCKSKSSMGEFIYYIFFVFLIICLIMNLICIICQAVFLGRIIKYDLAYECSDEKTNEVSRLENLNTKKSILYTGVNLGLDIFYILFNVFAHLVILIKNKLEDCEFEFNLFSRNKDKETNNSDYNNNKNDFNANDHYKKPIREVIVNNGTQNQYDKPLDNDNFNNHINKNINNNNFDTPINDLGVPPAIAPGFTSDAKL